MNYWDGKGVDGATMRYISLGAGVQSSVMALMASRGEIGPTPDCAVFADTQWEPESVYTPPGMVGETIVFSCVPSNSRGYQGDITPNSGGYTSSIYACIYRHRQGWYQPSAVYIGV